jgi:hypothetical protein
MEHKKSRWHKKRVGGTKKESVEQNQSRPGIFGALPPWAYNSSAPHNITWLVYLEWKCIQIMFALIILIIDYIVLIVVCFS